MKLLLWIAGLAAAAVLLPAACLAGGQAYLSWSIDDQDGTPTVTWQITGSTKWYVGVVQVATRPEVNAKGDFLSQNVVAYDVLTHAQSTGIWQAPYKLHPGSYYGLLTLRYDGPCQTSCESRSSVRTFTVDPPALQSLTWEASVKSGKVTVAWQKPDNGWYVSMVLVDDDEDFSSPVDVGTWPAEPSDSTWTSQKLDPDTYYVRVHARYADCETCLWTSPVKKVEVGTTNKAPRFRQVAFSILRRDEATLHHTWRATFTVCDSSPGKLTLQIREETWPASGGTVKHTTSTVELKGAGGCRRYSVARRAAYALRSGTFYRIVLRARDSAGAWSAEDRSVQWYTS